MSDEMAVAADQAMQDSSLDIGTEQPEQSAFLDVDFGGEKITFKSPEEAVRHIKEGTLLQRDYTKKTQTLAEERRRFQQEQTQSKQQYEKELADFRKLKEKYDKYEEAFRRRPQIAAQLERLASQPANPDEIFQRSQGYADQKYNELLQKFETLEQQRERERLERQRDDTFSRLREKYGDQFDDTKVNSMLETLEEGNLEPLLELALRASLYNPGGEEARVLEKLERKQGARLPSGGGQPPANNQSNSNLDDSYEQALREYAGIEGV